MPCRYLTYGEAEWRRKTDGALQSMETYDPVVRHAFEHTLGWLEQWACSRSFGLGTKLPWDPEFLIESLSDSTIYMAYYTIAHILQEGDMFGAHRGAIKPEDITPVRSSPRLARSGARVLHPGLACMLSGDQLSSPLITGGVNTKMYACLHRVLAEQSQQLLRQYDLDQQYDVTFVWCWQSACDQQYQHRRQSRKSAHVRRPLLGVSQEGTKSTGLGDP